MCLYIAGINFKETMSIDTKTLGWKHRFKFKIMSLLKFNQQDNIQLVEACSPQKL